MPLDSQTAAPQPEASAVVDRPPGRLPRLTMVLWGIGPMGAATVLTLIGTQLLIYLTDFVAMSPAVAGGLLFVAKLSDVLTDLAVGLASDRINTRWGRRRPWLLGGTILIALSCPLMFHIDRLAPQVRASAAVGAIVLFYTGYSLFYIPHQAMSAEMTQDYQERTSIVSWFYLFGTLSFVTGIALAPGIISAFGNRVEGFHAMSWIIAALPLATGLACLIGTRHAPATASPRGLRTPVGVWIRSMAGNTPLVVLVLSKFIHYFSVALIMGGLVYFTLYVLLLGQWGMVIAGFAMTGGSVSGLYVFVALSKRLQKHVIYAGALFGMGAAAMSFALLDRASGPVLFGFFCFLYGVAGAGLVMAQSMILDVMEWDYRRTGLRREGAVVSLVSAIGKATPAFAALLVGLMLSYEGYVAGKPGAVQSERTIWAIKMCVSIVPGVLLIGAAVLLYLLYDLTRDKLESAEPTALAG